MHRLSDHATVPHMRRALLLLSTAFALTAAASAADLRLGIAVEPDSIDPHYHNFGGNKGLMPNVFDALTSIDPHDHLIPSLALSWKLTDRTTWEFKLREGVTFSDDTPLTADDVAFTIDRVPNVPTTVTDMSEYVKQIARVEVKDRRQRWRAAAGKSIPRPPRARSDESGNRSRRDPRPNHEWPVRSRQSIYEARPVWIRSRPAVSTFRSAARAAIADRGRLSGWFPPDRVVPERSLRQRRGDLPDAGADADPHRHRHDAGGDAACGVGATCQPARVQFVHLLLDHRYARAVDHADQPTRRARCRARARRFQPRRL